MLVNNISFSYETALLVFLEIAVCLILSVWLLIGRGQLVFLTLFDTVLSRELSHVFDPMTASSSKL